MMKSPLAAVVLLGFAVPALLLGQEREPFRVTTTEEGVQLEAGDAPVLFYQRATKAQNDRHARANYLHPLYDLDGSVLTEDFPRDHLHHRGVFWAWHQVWVGDQAMGDSWECRNFVWEVPEVKTVANTAGPAVVQARVLWKSPAWTDAQGQLKPFVEEQTTVRVHAADDDARKIDFTIRLLALEPNVRLGGSDDEKGYGGFSVRVRLPPGVRFVGEKGEVEPQITAVEAGPWLDISGHYGTGEELSGVTILEHPSLPGFPQPWILRRERSMQNPAFPGRQPVPLSTETPLVLRYRLVLHRGGPNRERLQAWFAEYAQEGAASETATATP